MGSLAVGQSGSRAVGQSGSLLLSRIHTTNTAHAQ